MTEAQVAQNRMRVALARFASAAADVNKHYDQALSELHQERTVGAAVQVEVLVTAFSTMYPFGRSFDEVVGQIQEWADDVRHQIPETP